MNILITGGAGFIGTHLTKKLLNEGATVTVLDNFSPQIHGIGAATKFIQHRGVRLIDGDVREKQVWLEALPGHDAVVHLAAETGTGQSMYEISRYEAVNIAGTANMFDCIVNHKLTNIRKIVVASSRAIYGEGSYECKEDGVVYPDQRTVIDLKGGYFEPRCPKCGEFIKMQSTAEDAPFKPTSFYGLTKQVQEQMVLMYARTLGISAYALRYQNVYGPGQSLNNPYTGILAIFSNLARENKPINVFEDGSESRDFVYINDVVDATAKCLQATLQDIASINVGSGRSTSVINVAHAVVSYFDSKSTVSVSGAFRLGDIRHNVANQTKARELLDYKAKWEFKDGLTEFLNWATLSDASDAGYERSLQELKVKGLMHD
jgi:dTDP-L-rhamnose 4-epimerase